jgi:predicted MFS family arabinose efflux permease
VVSVYYHLAALGVHVGRRLIMLLAVACGVSVANVYYAQPLLGRIGAGLHVGPAQLGLVTTVTQAGYLLGLILIVPLGDLADRRRLIVTQGLVAAAGLVMAGSATSTAVFFAASAVVGLACVVVQVIVAYAAALSAPGRRGAVVGSVTSGVVVGILLARTASGLIADLLGWRAVYFTSAGLMLALALALGLLLPPDTVRKQPASYPALIGSAVTLTARDRTFRVRSLIALFMFGGFGAVWGSIALPLAVAPWHLSAGQTGLFGIVGVAGALGASQAGRLADRGRAQWVTGACLLLLIASWAATRAAPYSLPLLAAGILALDFAGQALHVTSQQLIVAANPAASSRIIGSYMTFYSVGTGGGAIAATSLYSHAGWGAVSALGAGLSVMALLVWAADRLLPSGGTTLRGAHARHTVKQQGSHS